MQVAEKLDWKGLKIKISVGNRKVIMLEGPTEDRKGLIIKMSISDICSEVGKWM
jgi:hypothetical protein